MPTYPLAHRIRDFLQRQIEWSAAVLAELDQVDVEDGELEALLARQQRREREARSMAREYNGLFHEWQRDTTMDEGERSDLQRLSREAQELTGAVQRRYARAQQQADARRQSKQDALTELRRGQRSVTIYRPELLVSPGFLDRKA